MFSLLYSIFDCLLLSNWSPHQLLSNLLQLSAILIIFMITPPTTLMKLQLCSRSLHWLVLNLSQLFTTLIALPKSQLQTLLIKAFEHRVIDTHEFLLIIDARYMRCSIAYYQRHVESCIAVMNRVCYYCRLFISLLLLVVVLRSNPMVIVALDKDVINKAFLNHCSQEIDKYRFCYLCFNMLK